MKETMNNNFVTEEKVLVTAIDHGFGNMKTVNTCFKTGVTAYDSEPTFKNNLLVYGDRYFKIGEGHKEFIADKIQDEDYYILTLAATRHGVSTSNLPFTKEQPPEFWRKKAAYLKGAN